MALMNMFSKSQLFIFCIALLVVIFILLILYIVCCISRRRIKREKDSLFKGNDKKKDEINRLKIEVEDTKDIVVDEVVKLTLRKLAEIQLKQK